MPQGVRCEDPAHADGGRTATGRCRTCMAIGQRAYYRRLRDAYKLIQSQDAMRANLSV